MRSNIKIPDQLYVGVSPRNNNLPEAFMTPYGKDAASQGRKSTVDNWVARNARYFGSKSRAVIIGNEPFVGYRVCNCISRTGTDTWNIEDPRGFEIEITGPNLLNLMKTVTISNGEILEPCVWARSGSANVLLSVLSAEYKQAVSNTTAANRKASWRNVKPGNRIVLQNNMRGIYLGKMWQISYGIWSRQEKELADNDIKSSEKNVHVIFEESTDNKHYKSAIHLITAPKLSSIEDTSELDLKECELFANEKLHDSECCVHNNLYTKTIALTVKRPDIKNQVKLVSTTITFDTEQELIYHIQQNRSGSYKIIFIKTPTTFGKLGWYNHFNIVEYSYEHFLKNELRRNLHLSPSRKSYYNLWSERTQRWDFDNTVEFVNLDIEVTSELGNLLIYSIK